jgi:hypothetical protein
MYGTGLQKIVQSSICRSFNADRLTLWPFNFLGGVFANTSNSNLPSWLPDRRVKYSNNSLRFSDRMKDNAHWCSGSSKPDVALTNNSKELVIRGFWFDVIVSIDRRQLIQDMSSWITNQFGGYGAEYSFTNDFIEDAIVRTLAVDIYKDRRWTREAPRITQEVSEKENTSLDAWVDDNYRGLVYSVRRGHLVKTLKGILGLTPPRVEVGDILMIPLGGRVPIILRPCGDKYTFIGECYLHGFMDGEALVEARKASDTSYDGGDTSWLGCLHEEQIPFPTHIFSLI